MILFGRGLRCKLFGRKLFLCFVLGDMMLIRKLLHRIRVEKLIDYFQLYCFMLHRRLPTSLFILFPVLYLTYLKFPLFLNSVTFVCIIRHFSLKWLICFIFRSNIYNIFFFLNRKEWKYFLQRNFWNLILEKIFSKK